MIALRVRTAVVAALFVVASVAMLAGPSDAAVTSADIDPSYQSRPVNTFSASWTLSATLTATHSMNFTFGDGQGVTYHNLPSGTHHKFPSHTFPVWCGTGSKTYTQGLTFTGSTVSVSSKTQLTKDTAAC